METHLNHLKTEILGLDQDQDLTRWFVIKFLQFAERKAKFILIRHVGNFVICWATKLFEMIAGFPLLYWDECSAYYEEWQIGNKKRSNDGKREESRKKRKLDPKRDTFTSQLAWDVYRAINNFNKLNGSDFIYN